MVIGAAFANTNPVDDARKTEANVSLVQWKDQVHRLFYTGDEAGKVLVRIEDERGKTLLRKTVQNKKGFALPINFKDQGYGTYEIIITDRNGTYSEQFTVEPVKKPCGCA